MSDPNEEALFHAAVNAAATIGAIYEMFDRVERAGGATSIEGVAACNTMLASLRKNRPRVKKLIAEPINKLIKERTS